MGAKKGQDQSAGGVHDGDVSKAAQTTGAKVRHKTREQGKHPLKPQLVWSELDALFDASGAHAIQAAAACKENRDRSRYYLRPEDSSMIEFLRNTMNYTDKGLLNVLRQHYGLGPKELDKSGHTQLHRTAAAGDLDTVETLLARSAIDADNPTDPGGVTPLMTACQHGHEAVVAALMCAAGRGDGATVALLLDAGARDDDCAETTNGIGQGSVLLRALEHGHGAVARMLIERVGSDVRATSKRGETCLHLVKDAETCRLLLQLGVGDDGRINALDSQTGRTALHSASDEGVVKA
jgi:hypothetical protein